MFYNNGHLSDILDIFRTFIGHQLKGKSTYYVLRKVGDNLLKREREVYYVIAQ